MNNQVYVWDKIDHLCYATFLPNSAFNRQNFFVLGFVEVDNWHGTQADLERQIARQPWYRAEFGFPVLGVDPIPF